MKIFSYNARGVGKRAKRKEIKEYIRNLESIYVVFKKPSCKKWRNQYAEQFGGILDMIGYIKRQKERLEVCLQFGTPIVFANRVLGLQMVFWWLTETGKLMALL